MQIDRWLKQELTRKFRQLDPKLRWFLLAGLALFLALTWLSELNLDSNTSKPEVSSEELEPVQRVQTTDEVALDLTNLIPPLDPGASVSAIVTRVVDGDTIIVNKNGSDYRLRLIGIDTPETVHPSREVECFGPEASAYVAEILDGRQVYLEKDISETDRFDRLLRYVWLEDIMVNQILVQQGFAQAVSYPPDVRYYQHFLADQELAKEAGLGLWGEVCQDE